MGDVVSLNTQTTLDLSAEKVLNAALEANLDHVIVIGYNKSGKYHAVTTSDVADIIFRMEMFKQTLLTEVLERTL